MSTIHQRLEDARRSLLDLTRRNRLLNFRPGRKSSVHIVDELAEDVYGLLAAAGKTMQFRALEEAPPETRLEEEGRDLPEGSTAETFELGAIDEPAAAAERHVDLRLQTALGGTRLQATLLHLDREARSALQEQGCNVLYLAIGLLRWVDGGPGDGPDREEESSLAPLLLVPVELVRRTARHRHAVRALDEEIVVNPVLAELCRRRFKLELPDFDSEAERPVASFLAAVEACIAGMGGWSVLREIHLGLFTFAKLLMYLDLQDEKWPAEAPLTSHELVRGVFGLPSAEDGAPSAAPGEDGADPAPVPHDLDDAIHPRDSFQVLDADSTQQRAILAAKSGASMVIHGPPGTGKSQTITNIIAECLAEGKTVLFVAEKAAALEVVKRRLEAVGLGDFVSELHSRKASKKQYLETLARALGRRFPEPDSRELVTADELARVRAALNAYVRELHRSVAPLGLTPFEAIGACAALEDAPEAPVDLGDVAGWDRERFDRCGELVEALAAAAARIGDPARHPWRGAGRTEIDLPLRQKLPVLTGGLAAAVEGLVKTADATAERLAAPPVSSVAEARELADVLDAVACAPTIDAPRASAPAWASMPGAVPGLLDAGRRLEALRAELGGRWKDSAERVDWAPVHERFVRRGGSLLRFLTPSWWQDRRLVRFHLGERTKLERRALLDDLAALTELRELRERIDRFQATAVELFGAHWRDDRSAWDELDLYARAVVGLREFVAEGRLSEKSIGFVAGERGREEAIELGGRLRGAADAAIARWRELSSALSVDALAFLGDDPTTAPLAAMRTRVREAGAAQESIDDWASFRRASRACEDEGIGAFRDWTSGDGCSAGPATWPRAFRRQFHRLWLDAVSRRSPALHDFRGEDHERLVERFRRLDAEWIRITRRRLAAAVAARRPSLDRVTSNNSGLGILRAEMRRKRRIRPIRKLLASPAGAAIQRITPCFMMSPISVAQFLEPGRLRFDVVIFDEASQVEPADALGAVARGRQLILVGDENQLPPTNFFRPSGELYDEEDDEEEAAPAADLESVLALGQAFLPHNETLRWHYRSRHHSLIGFSNAAFYRGELRVFPSPSIRDPKLGLEFRHVPGAVYLRGRGRYNREEAREVAREVIRHAREAPALSLGVAAFSISQQRAIEDEIELLRREENDDAVEAFFGAEREEPFFVKNLETVQGDERDVIFLSVGYGRDERGAMSQHFGPLNRDGGWRRLNVLVTRARRACVLFSSITSDEITVGENTPRGVRALKAYLQHATSGSTSGPERRRVDGLPDLSVAVCERLRRGGWEVHERIGAAGFPIDLAVVESEGRRYVAGLECDGPTYRAAVTARDRDRLRGAVLEGLGWRLVRVWSPDWARQPGTMLERLLDRVETLAAATASDGDAPPARAEPAPAPGPSRSPGDEAEAELPPGVVPYERYRGPRRGDRERLLSASPDELAPLLGEVVAVEGPIHCEELFRVVAGLHATRAAGDVRTALDAALAAAESAGRVARRGDFVWLAGMERTRVRWRGGDDAVADAELIAPEEVAEAAALAARNEFGIPVDELPAAAIRTLGFKRVGPQLAELGARGAELAVERRLVAEDVSGHVLALETRDVTAESQEFVPNARAGATATEAREVTRGPRR